ncbi:hypothetical protein DFH28DRAFT_982153, partial [Melampsora americana]
MIAHIRTHTKTLGHTQKNKMITDERIKKTAKNPPFISFHNLNHKLIVLVTLECFCIPTIPAFSESIFEVISILLSFFVQLYTVRILFSHLSSFLLVTLLSDFRFFLDLIDPL